MRSSGNRSLQAALSAANHGMRSVSWDIDHVKDLQRLITIVQTKTALKSAA